MNNAKRYAILTSVILCGSKEIILGKQMTIYWDLCKCLIEKNCNYKIVNLGLKMRLIRANKYLLAPIYGRLEFE